MIQEGIWWVASETDPRWNKEGRGFVGGFTMPTDAKEWIEQIKKKLKSGLPKDLMCGYEKEYSHYTTEVLK